MIRIQDIITRYDIASKFPTILEDLGMEILKDGINVEKPGPPCGDMPGESLLKNNDDLEKYLFGITRVDIKHFYTYDRYTIDYITFYLDLWCHAGYPGGESDRYIGRITLSIESFAFLLIAAKYL